MKNHCIPIDGFLLLIAFPSREIGRDRALAEVKCCFLTEFSARIIRAEFPMLKDKMHVRSAIVAWQSPVVEVMDPSAAW
ncbi:MAG: hypothetical protein ABIU05_02505 [Nitrospirales bacterium]